MRDGQVFKLSIIPESLHLQHLYFPCLKSGIDEKYFSLVEYNHIVVLGHIFHQMDQMLEQNHCYQYRDILSPIEVYMHPEYWVSLGEFRSFLVTLAWVLGLFKSFWLICFEQGSSDRDLPWGLALVPKEHEHRFLIPWQMSLYNQFLQYFVPLAQWGRSVLSL